jgi:hypothetical protein
LLGDVPRISSSVSPAAADSADLPGLANVGGADAPRGLLVQAHVKEAVGSGGDRLDERDGSTRKESFWISMVSRAWD